MNNLLVSYKPVRVTNYPYTEQFNQSSYTDGNTQDTIGNFPDTLQLPITKQSDQKTDQGFAGWIIPSQSTSQSDNNLSFEELVSKYNLPVQITSGFRQNSKTKSGKHSNHSKKDEHGHPMAYDIQPLVNGKVDKSDSAFANLKQILSSNQNVRNWFKVRNWGILDETTPQMMSKTGATGKHFHIGPDSTAERFS